jgi:hypothetical protein
VNRESGKLTVTAVRRSAPSTRRGGTPATRPAGPHIDGFTSDLAEGQAARYAYERAERDAAMAATLSTVWAG